VRVPLHELAADVGHRVQRRAGGEHVHRRDEPAPAARGVVHERLGPVRVEGDAVVEERRVDQVLVAGEAIADRAEAGVLGHPWVGPPGQPRERHGHQLLGLRLLRRGDAGRAAEVDGQRRVVGDRLGGGPAVRRLRREVPAGVAGPAGVLVVGDARRGDGRRRRHRHDRRPHRQAQPAGTGAQGQDAQHPGRDGERGAQGVGGLDRLRDPQARHGQAGGLGQQPPAHRPAGQQHAGLGRGGGRHLCDGTSGSCPLTAVRRRRPARAPAARRTRRARRRAPHGPPGAGRQPCRRRG
jgi:hypothetical protein